MQTTQLETKNLMRSATFTRAGINEKDRTITATAATETPVERGGYREVLKCSPEAVDLSRLTDGAPFLNDHDSRRQIGVIQDAQVSGKRLLVVIRFGRTAEAEEQWQEVRGGIRTKLSVGYTIQQHEETRDGTVIATRWQPLEVSLVSIPADNNAAIGRSHHSVTMNSNTSPDTIGALADAYATRIQGYSQDQIRSEAARFELEGRSVDDFKQHLLGLLSNRPLAISIEEPATQTRNSDTAQRVPINHRGSTLTPGEMVVRSPEFQQIVRGHKRGRYCVTVETPGSPQLHLRSTLTSSGLTNYDRPAGGVIDIAQQPLLISERFGQAMTNSPTIRFPAESSFTNAATAVAEEGQKPEATFALTETDVAVKKIAVVARVTDEALADYDYMANYINTRLMFMVAALEDNHLLNGTGLSNQITGILNVSGIQTESSANSSTVADAIFKGITKVTSTPGFIGSVDTIVIHPTDWQNLRLTKDGNGQYYGNGTFTGPYGTSTTTGDTIWGKPAIITTAIAQGTALVGAFKLGATVFRRQGLSIEMTNSDASDFQYNRVAFRAETRLCLCPWRASAFCKITGIPAS